MQAQRASEFCHVWIHWLTPCARKFTILELLLVQSMNCVVDNSFEVFTVSRLQSAFDFHAPSRGQFGNRQCDCLAVS